MAEPKNFRELAKRKIAELTSEIVSTDGDVFELPLITELSGFLEDSSEGGLTTEEIARGEAYLTYKANLEQGDLSEESFRWNDDEFWNDDDFWIED